MKRLICFFFMVSLFCFPSAFADGRVYALKAGQMYTVGDKIAAGIYSVSLNESKSSLGFAEVSIGDNLHQNGNQMNANDYFCRFQVTKGNSEGPYELKDGQKVYINAGYVKFTPSSKEPIKQNAVNIASVADSSSKLSGEELKKIVNSSPYVSSKDVVIDSPEGFDFYTYFGSGIIMSTVAGDCFKMVACDDENIVDHYKLMPIKAGKGRIEYIVNSKKIFVNVTVRESAFEKTLDSSVAVNIAKATKNVNLRSKASTSSSKVGSLKKGETVSVITPFYSPDWHEIEYKNKTCYVSAQFVELE